VGGGGHDFAVLEGVLELLGGHEATDVGHVAHEERAALVRDGPEARVVPVAGYALPPQMMSLGGSPWPSPPASRSPTSPVSELTCSQKSQVTRQKPK